MLINSLTHGLFFYFHIKLNSIPTKYSFFKHDIPIAFIKMFWKYVHEILKTFRKYSGFKENKMRIILMKRQNANVLCNEKKLLKEYYRLQWLFSKNMFLYFPITAGSYLGSVFVWLI